MHSRQGLIQARPRVRDKALTDVASIFSPSGLGNERRRGVTFLLAHRAGDGGSRHEMRLL